MKQPLTVSLFEKNKKQFCKKVNKYIKFSKTSCYIKGFTTKEKEINSDQEPHSDDFQGRILFRWHMSVVCT